MLNKHLHPKNKVVAPILILASAALTLSACSSKAADTNITPDASGSASAGGAMSGEKIKTAVSASEIGGLEALEKAAKAEGQLNLIALPHDWSNWGEVIAAFKAKYPEITVNEANPNASSKEEIDAIKTNAGTDKAPDTVDVSPGVAADSVQYFAPYKVAAWDKIPAGNKEASGLFTADYSGVMTIGWNKTKYGDITSLEQLTDPKFKGTVALNGKPSEAGAAFNGFLMINLAQGGTLKNLQPGLDYFKKLKDAGTLTTVDVTNATIDSGQTGVVMDWSYNQASTAVRLKNQGVDWQYKVFPGSEVASFYNQALNKDAPHPAAARLWLEFLYTPEAQNLWLKGGSIPILLPEMKKEGSVNQEYLDKQVKLSKDPTTYSLDQSKEITEWLSQNWDKTIGN
ncbi:extracellular solute-binding protein [Actinomycetaceae bacterium TAE3-ERU4]|nr:extracellular solute-binding protein [Actinomycetaceae bacterium TAE3-ERU4]